MSGPIGAWLRLGFTPASDDHICLPDFGVRFVAGVDGAPSRVGGDDSTVCGWSLVDADREPDSPPQHCVVDGIETWVIPGPPCTSPSASSLGAIGVDHVVVMTGNLERTCGAISKATGAELKRVREAGRGVRQGFHRLGSVILEIVERPDLQPSTPAAIWGLVLTVVDLDGAVARLGSDVVGRPRQAVQPGRRIATVATDAGLGLAVALMSPAL
ncbi:MAG: VOC family protein [Ilumatobacteraceae bacterium]